MGRKTKMTQRTEYMTLMRVSDQRVSETYAYVHGQYDLPAGVNKSGNKEKIPATEAISNVRKYSLFSAASRLTVDISERLGQVGRRTHLNGTSTRRNAFSCTCHPNM